MKKQVIGMRMKYAAYAGAANIFLLTAMFLPYVKKEGCSLSAFALLSGIMGNGLSGLSYILAAAVCLPVILVLLGILNMIKPSIPVSKVMMVTGAVEALVMSLLIINSKKMIDLSGIAGDKFMVKDFGIGFWLALVLSYFALAAVMKSIKVHPGHIILALMSVVWLFPIVWIILTSLREESGYYVGYFFPKGLTLDNYRSMLDPAGVIPFAKWWSNTFYVAAAICVINTVIVLTTAFTLSRIRFAGRITLMKVMLIIGMFPGFMSMIAVYNILKGIGLAQTLTALVIVGAAGAAMGYYISKGFFDTIPKSLDEAAVIDGATKFQIFTRIILPLSKPILVYTVLTSFLGPWGDYIFPYMLLGDNSNSYTVAIGLNWLRDFRRIDTYYTQFAAGAVMVSLPIVILFLLLQRFYVEGLSGSVKG